MKKLLVSALLLTTALQAEDFWQGCAKNEKEAKNNLAKNIMVKVESSSSTKSSSSMGNWFESISQDTNQQSKQSTSMMLTDLKTFKNDDGEVCVKVEKDTLHKFTKEKVNAVDANYKITALAKNKKERSFMIQKWLKDLQYLKGLAEVFSDISLEKINQKIAKLTNIQENLATQYVKINIFGKEGKVEEKSGYFNKIKKALLGNESLKVDGKSQDFSKEIYLKPGKHTYTISGDHCTISEEFEVEEDKDSTISVNLNEYAFPRLTISANKDSVNLKVDGKKVTLGSEYSPKKCNGSIHYELSYSDGEPKKIEKDLTLEPGMNESYSYDSFVSFQELQALSKFAKQFHKGRRVELTYNYSMPDINVNDGKDLNSLQVFGGSYLYLNKWLRHGYRANISFGKNDSFTVQASYLAAFQLTSVGVDKRSLHIGSSLAYIPYLGIEGGVGYTNLYNSKTEKLQHSFRNFSKGEQVLHDYFILRPVAGIDFVFTEFMAFGVEFSKSFTMQKAYSAGFHISLGLPNE